MEWPKKWGLSVGRLDVRPPCESRLKAPPKFPFGDEKALRSKKNSFRIRMREEKSVYFPQVEFCQREIRTWSTEGGTVAVINLVGKSKTRLIKIGFPPACGRRRRHLRNVY
ncbi:hypothetical protein EVAR_93735_1 [Eumeta japonica]|uniref:Uncharacterized protein n=1 Tax=Eumeta variegata TaxID=151549 RepID=A0A4C1U2S6_EUMVA|nr:hypothetical protein EVAR_93735_1 [Eumeta japonica]